VVAASCSNAYSSQQQSQRSSSCPLRHPRAAQRGTGRAYFLIRPNASARSNAASAEMEAGEATIDIPHEGSSLPVLEGIVSLRMVHRSLVRAIRPISSSLASHDRSQKRLRAVRPPCLRERFQIRNEKHQIPRGAQLLERASREDLVHIRQIRTYRLRWNILPALSCWLHPSHRLLTRAPDLGRKRGGPSHLRECACRQVPKAIFSYVVNKLRFTEHPFPFSRRNHHSPQRSARFLRMRSF
jgi:hypothetical protein